MNLIDALEINLESKGIISFVGAGGKTSTMFRLAKELKEKNKKILITTTTMIFYPSKDEYDDICISKNLEDILKKFKNTNLGSISILGTAIKENKLKGIPIDLVNLIYKANIFDYILIEADGSKRKPIKAPAKHEPVIPKETDILIGVIGFDVYGKELNNKWVHRPENLINIAGACENQVIDKEIIKKLVISNKGLFKDSPSNSTKILLLNKVNYEGLDIAKNIGSDVLKKSKEIKKVLIGRVKSTNPITVVLGDKND